MYHNELSNHFDEWVMSQLHENCPYCGSPIWTSSNLRRRACSNTSCCRKYAAKAEILLKLLGLKGIGTEKAMAILKDNNMTNHFEILDRSKYKDQDGSSAAEKVILEFIDSGIEPLSMHKFIQALGLDGIGESRAIEITQNCLTVEEIDDEGVKENINILKYAIDLIGMKPKYIVKPIKLMITNSINGFTREGFIDHLNNLYGDVFVFSSVGMNLGASALVSDKLDGTQKEVFAKKNRIPIFNSEEFLFSIKMEALERRIRS